MLKGHRVVVRRLLGNTALAFHVALSVVILHCFFEIARFGRLLIDCFHRAVGDLVRSLRADRLARRFNDALGRLVRWDRAFLESFALADKSAPKAFDESKTIMRTLPGQRQE